MKQLVEKLISLERKIAEEKGSFSLFALFLREDAEDRWDLLASAPWLQKDKKDGLIYLASQLRKSLKQEEMLTISRIVLVDEKHPAFKAVQTVVDVEHAKGIEVRDSTFFGLRIKHAYIITSRRRKSRPKSGRGQGDEEKH